MIASGDTHSSPCALCQWCGGFSCTGNIRNGGTLWVVLRFDPFAYLLSYYLEQVYTSESALCSCDFLCDGELLL